jgi:starch-binding outer membrane protein, SusD/RagB family
MQIHFNNAAGRLRRVGLSAAIGVLILTPSACDTDTALKVVDPALATPGSVQTKSAVPTVFAGALGDFYVAWSGNGLNDAFNATTGLFTDEFRSSDTFTTRNDADRRTQTGPSNGNLADIPYTALQRARRSNESAARLIAQFFPANDPRIAETLSLAGFTYVALGEAWCSGTPVPSSETAEQFIPAPGITTAQMFDTAALRFNAAITGLGGATDATSVARRRLAQIGLARALMNNGKYAEAATAVASIPDNFVYFNDHSANTPREENSIWNLNGSNRRYTVSDVEGGNGLNYRTANDPRIPWLDQNRNGFDNATRLFEQLKFSNRDADVPLATGVEARLIEAEAALKAGDVTTWLAKLNGIRAQVRTLMTAYTNPQTYTTNNPNTFVTNTTLAPLTDPGTTASRVDLTFRERAFWMYGTGHRLGDLRRLIRQYGRSAESVFPTGTWHKGGPYGTDVALVVPFNEEQNPLFVRAGCQVNVP